MFCRQERPLLVIDDEIILVLYANYILSYNLNHIRDCFRSGMAPHYQFYFVGLKKY